MPELGRAALVVCFGLALYAVVAGFWGAHNDGWHYELLFIAMCLVIATIGPGRFALWDWGMLY